MVPPEHTGKLNLLTWIWRESNEQGRGGERGYNGVTMGSSFEGVETGYNRVLI